MELVEQGKIKHFRDLNAIVMGLHHGGRILDSELEDDGPGIASDRQRQWALERSALGAEFSNPGGV